MNRKNQLLLLACLLVMTSPAFADTPSYDLGSIMTAYHDAATKFGANITATALSLCYKLFAIDLAWAVLGRLIKGADVVEIGTVLIMRVMWLGMVIWVMNNPSVPLAVVNSFIQIGKDGAGTTAISPGNVFWQGIDLVNLMMSKFSDTASVAGIPVPAGMAAMANPFAAFLIGGSLIIIIVCFAMLAAQFAVAWIQLWFYIAIYPIALAFGVMKWTKDIAMKIITTPLVYGVRFLAIYFVIAVGTNLAAEFGTEIGKLSLTNLTPIWTVLAGSVLLLVLAMKIPTMASDLLGGTASMSAADGVGATLAGGGAIAAAAGGLYAAGGAAANGVSAAMKAGSSAISKVAGAGAGTGTSAGGVSAAAGAPGGAVPGLPSAGAPGNGSAPAPSSPAAAQSAGSTARTDSPATPGAQPAAPAAAASVPTSPAAPSAASSAGSAAPDAPGGGQPAAPAASVPSPASPSASVVPASTTPPAPPSAASPAGSPAPDARSGQPAAPAAAVPNAGVPSAPIPAEAAGPSPTDAGGSISAPGENVTDNGVSNPQPQAPSAARKSVDAVKGVLEEMQKTSGGGQGIQTHSGGDD